MDPQLVDRIYECAFMPDEWPKALGELAAIATARTGFLFVSKGEIHRVVGSTDFGLETIKPFVESGMVARTERSRRLLTARDSRFLTEAELYPAGDSADDLTYRTISLPARLRTRRGDSGAAADRRQFHHRARARIRARTGRARRARQARRNSSPHSPRRHHVSPSATRTGARDHPGSGGAWSRGPGLRRAAAKSSRPIP